ncbi:daunorubicin resistance protein DrrA family ABC transporter ATP-binding protein [Cucumibacter marinus]|uniref:daunorubicin resistance protein DrrA family ABC transporter ATP-binding protein n=1 Tax=Cucumibacter marinus TaxID=1121252 RepID=UPI000412C430|nr:daunorubicin resistance protein DrrA family ABC transporter ATP-binding protein [Cucumibacter marinus]
MTTSDQAVETHGLRKLYGGKPAVDGIDLMIPKGSIFGLLGPNGAGKTTTVRMLATLARPDGGEARVLGHDLVREAAALRRRIALTGQFASVDEDLSGQENLVLIGRLLGFSRKGARARAEELLEAFGIADAANKQAKSYSGGMRRRLDIASSLVTTPELLFLDEPTTGLDPRSRNQVWDIIRRLTAAGTTVLLTTQYLEEADQLADRIAVIDHGRMIAEGTSTELKASVGAGALHVRLAEPGRREAAQTILEKALGVTVEFDSEPRRLNAMVPDDASAGHALAALADAGIAVSDFSLGQPSLDEVFFALTGHHTETETPVAAEAVSKEAAQ